jgi:hypothetical protein
METKIVIFLAFTSLTLIFNACVIWFAYKAFAKASTVVADTFREMERSDSTKAWLKGLEVACSAAVTVTEKTRAELAHIDPMLSRAQAKYEFKLAEIDIQLERSFATVLRKTAHMQRVLVEPAHRIGAVISGVSEVFQFLSGEAERVGNADDASSTQKP